MTRILIALTAVALLAPALPALDLSGLETIPVQEGGRKKPFLVFADESILSISGKTKIQRGEESLNALEATTTLWLAPDGWDKERIILFNQKALKARLGFPTDRKLFSYEELASNSGFRDVLREVTDLREKNPKVKLNPQLKAAKDVGMRLAIYEGLLSGRMITPLPTGAAAWSPLASDDPALIKLRAGFASKDQSLFDEGLALLRSEQARENPRFQADPQKISIETFYQKFHPFRWAWISYLAAGIVLMVFAGTTFGYRAGWAFALLGFGLQVWGFVLRILVADRPPVTNMYESVLWVAFGTILFAFIFEGIYRCRYCLLGAIPVAIVCLILADTQPVVLNRAIHPLVPVLADNFWLTTHVLTITISYSAFALALGVGHIALGKVIVGVKPSPALYTYLYRSLQVGVLLLAVGTILGGVWANYSWGRFWDWDPKETWALIALLGYLFVLHGRIAGKWGGFGMAVGAVLAFQSIIMAWYGVNFILGVGLHSYGFGTGGLPLAVAFVIAEVTFVAIAIVRKNHRPALVAAQ